jgi:hypothetical protein
MEMRQMKTVNYIQDNYTKKPLGRPFLTDMLAITRYGRVAYEIHYKVVWLYTELCTVMTAVAADFFFNCWILGDPFG